MRKLSLTLAAVFAGLLGLQTVVAVVIAEGALHNHRKPLKVADRAFAYESAQQNEATVRETQIASYDGARLAGWWFDPRHGNGETVILIHGHGDNRAGMKNLVRLFLRHHYAVLTADVRAHGESGGEFGTFGINESRDLSKWIDWIKARDARGCVYGLGESLGASILLQALPTEPRFCAVAAESPYSSFREVAYDRMGQKFGAGAGVGRTIFRPLVSEGFFYSKLRYGIDLDQADAAAAVASTHVPVLLIHGLDDSNIPLRHCEGILKNHWGPMELWQVPGAGHTGAFGADPEEFERRVTEWFSRYQGK